MRHSPPVCVRPADKLRSMTSDPHAAEFGAMSAVGESADTLERT